MRKNSPSTVLRTSLIKFTGYVPLPGRRYHRRWQVRRVNFCVEEDVASVIDWVGSTSLRWSSPTRPERRAEPDGPPHETSETPEGHEVDGWEVTERKECRRSVFRNHSKRGVGGRNLHNHKPLPQRSPTRLLPRVRPALPSHGSCRTPDRTSSLLSGLMPGSCPTVSVERKDCF